MAAYASASLFPLASSLPSNTSSPAPSCPSSSSHVQLPLLSPAPLIKTRPFTKHPSPLLAARRISDYTQEATLVTGPRHWGGAEFEDDDDESDDEGEEDDRSLDLLVRFIQNVFRKISRRARRAVRSVLPVPISARLLRFSVNGVLMLTFLWVLKAFLEVVCTLGSVVFITILVIRGVWTGVLYLNMIRSRNPSGFDEDNSAWNSAQPAT